MKGQTSRAEPDKMPASGLLITLKWFPPDSREQIPSDNVKKYYILAIIFCLGVEKGLRLYILHKYPNSAREDYIGDSKLVKIKKQKLTTPN
jgi:hypothetical protein